MPPFPTAIAALLLLGAGLALGCAAALTARAPSGPLAVAQQAIGHHYDPLPR